MRVPLMGMLLAVLCLAGSAQEKTASERPIDLWLTAVGRQHHQIQTTSREAQTYFDQGLTLVYGFNHEEAERSFRRASELDPASPMPLWGVAMAVGPNYNLEVDARREKQAYDTIQKAQELAANAPQIEKDYVAALAARYSAEGSPNYKQLALDYANAMGNLSRKYPDDLDAATLYASSLMNLNPWKLWSLDGQPGERTEEIVHVLESVLMRSPHHAGANHLYIHALEASPHPERALQSARRLETLVPHAAHLVHMPAHIYIRTGDYDAAAKNNVEALSVDKTYLQRSGPFAGMYDILYYSHNLHFLSAAESMAGNFAGAKRAADELEAHILPMVKEMPDAEVYLPTPIFVLLRFHRWEELLKSTPPDASLAMTSALWHFGRGCAAAATGKTEMAKQERKILEAVRTKTSETEAFGMFFTSAREFLDLAAIALDARLAMARGDNDRAVEYWTMAVRAQDRFRYNEPPEWFYPVRESLGAALLASGKAAEAEQVFREDLRRNPRNPRSLFGLMNSLNAQGKNADAAGVERQFKTAWKNADSALKVSDL
ncbi:MAG TPA: hypothetical protein VE077_04930 [Candidatus Methylomirabilis sp.]|nr:hypothetical protein [Candidatus Methylomirabilis sp.]